MNEFKALVVNKTDSAFTVNIQTVSIDELPKGEVLIHVQYSVSIIKTGWRVFQMAKL